jgi:hypothetical protein
MKQQKYIIVNNFKMRNKIVMMPKKPFFLECVHRSYCKLHELHECSSFQVKPCIPMKSLAKYGVDVNKISEEDYNRTIAQLKNEIQKQ